MSGGGLYGARRSPCGCRGVPEGQHLPGCPRCGAEAAPRCGGCDRRAATEAGACGICGAPRPGAAEREGRLFAVAGPGPRRASRSLEALIVRDPAYGEEVSLELAGSGRTIRTDAGLPGRPTVGADYVRVIDRGGVELCCWSHGEWAEDPVAVMGAILALAGGS